MLSKVDDVEAVVLRGLLRPQSAHKHLQYGSGGAGFDAGRADRINLSRRRRRHDRY